MSLITGILCRCEHYDSSTNRDHLINYEVGSGLYDLEYLEAIFHEDQELIEEIEESYAPDGLGPLASCSTMSNFNSMKVTCRK